MNIIGDDDSKKREVANKLRSDNLCSKYKIISIKERSPFSYTIKCASAEDADEVCKLLSNKYIPSVEFKSVVIRKPEIKIVRIFTELPSVADIEEQLRTQNSWLKEAIFKIEQVYQISTPNQKYYNIIISCEIEVQELFLNKGAVICNFNECKVYENISLLQCTKCVGYGHIAKECKNQIKCKKCADNHTTTDCTAETLKCANCFSANETNNKNFNTRHNAAFDRCPVRLERINALKNLLTTKN